VIFVHFSNRAFRILPDRSIDVLFSLSFPPPFFVVCLCINFFSSSVLRCLSMYQFLFLLRSSLSVYVSISFPPPFFVVCLCINFFSSSVLRCLSMYQSDHSLKSSGRTCHGFLSRTTRYLCFFFFSALSLSQFLFVNFPFCFVSTSIPCCSLSV